jgi:hypothetical protein
MNLSKADARGGGVFVRIAASAWLILFLELALIRFLSAYVRVFAFYTNFVIIAAFLGIGAGMLRRTQVSQLRWTMPVILGGICLITLWLSQTPIDVRPDHLEWLWGSSAATPGERHVPLAVAVIGLFVGSAALFIPLGAMLGSAMAERRALPAYVADLSGSLLGVGSFAIMSAASLPPVAWFATAGVVWLTQVGRSIPALAASVLGFGVAIGSAATLGSRNADIWSPYYRITLEPHELPGATTLNVNGVLHQVMLDFRRAAESPVLAAQRAAYERPYQHVARLDTALVVGAGTGNDIAILLALGAKHIDAVEIDPVIARIGREQHPMRPYDDPRVHLTVTDARAFLRSPPRRYDVVTFGTLDSQTLLGGMTSVRLDNYVYTQESFRSAASALAPGGSVVMYHLSGLWFVSARLFQNLEQAFGSTPRVFMNTDGLFSHTFVAGAGAAGAEAVAEGTPLRIQLKLSTDNWPFPYLRGRRIPSHYIVVLAAVLALSIGVVAFAAGASTMRKPDWPLFWVGCGFLLLETKGITTLSLLFGSTWTVNAAVIASILGVALAAAVITHKGRAPPVPIATAALAILLIIATLVEPSWLVSTAPWLRWLAAALYVGLPVMFASFVFSTAYAATADATSALAFNILGAVAGGLLEYASMSFGLSALNWLALASYLFAVYLLKRDGRSQRPVAA